MRDGRIIVFAGSASTKLTRNICELLDTEVGMGESFTFSDGNTFVRVLENVRGRDVYVVQSTIYPTNDNFVELLFWIDALQRSSASSVTVIIPYFSYGKGDKKDEPRVSIRARVCADAIEAAGASRVITMDLHAPQIQGFFKIPVDNLYAMPTLCGEISRMSYGDMVVVSPDAGFFAQARKYAQFLDSPMAVVLKERTAHDERATALEVIGNVETKTAVLVDDFVISGRTLAGAAEKLVDLGATRVVAAVTHGVLSPDACTVIDNSPIERIFVTDTIENQPGPISPKVTFVSVAHVFAEAIRRIHSRESISKMFA